MYLKGNFYRFFDKLVKNRNFRIFEFSNNSPRLWFKIDQSFFSSKIQTGLPLVSLSGALSTLKPEFF